jgi:hypothetical protein
MTPQERRAANAEAAANRAEPRVEAMLPMKGGRGALVPCDPDGLLYEGSGHVVRRYRDTWPNRFRVTNKIGGAQTDMYEEHITRVAALLGYDGAALTPRQAAEVASDG